MAMLPGALLVSPALVLYADGGFRLLDFVFALALGVGGYVVSKQLQIGDLDPGAPELRANSRYNVDNAFITSSYALSSDVFAVIVKTPPEQCMQYATLQQADRLSWQLQQLIVMPSTAEPIVETISASTSARCRSVSWKTAAVESKVPSRRNPVATSDPTASGPDGAGLGLIPWPTVDFTKFGPVERKDMSRIRKISAANLQAISDASGGAECRQSDRPGSICERVAGRAQSHDKCTAYSGARQFGHSCEWQHDQRHYGQDDCASEDGTQQLRQFLRCFCFSQNLTK